MMRESLENSGNNRGKFTTCSAVDDFKGFLVMGSGSNQLCAIFAKRTNLLGTIPKSTSLQTTGFRKDNFCRRFHISVQQKTNNKAKSVYERIHKIKNYHYYVIYLLGKEKHTAVVSYFSQD